MSASVGPSSKWGAGALPWLQPLCAQQTRLPVAGAFPGTLGLQGAQSGLEAAGGETKLGSEFSARLPLADKESL